MKRFWKQAGMQPARDGWQAALDGRGVRTVAGAPQIVPTQALAEALAAEWEAQGQEVDPGRFVLRDLADYAIDVVAPDHAAAIDALLPYGDTDTLLYRADPDEPLYRRQQAEWEPLVTAAEARLGASFTRVSGVLHRAQPEATAARLRTELETLGAFDLAALRTLAGIAASLIAGLAALDPQADTGALFDAAHLEETWQAELWGQDAEAEAARAARRAAFVAAARFAALARRAAG
ncbi:MAG: molecular chaperone [Sphingomonadales bacterium]|nr:molecular chaperone [Sphingomonadales bacterium]MDE2567485.1 molecular chaperone [Sphingomonadales bacterium]